MDLHLVKRISVVVFQTHVFSGTPVKKEEVRV